MGAASYYRGHKIEYINNEWVYSDTKKLVSEDKTRACGKCANNETKEGHDACLGELPGLMNACCGHGADEPYIQFLDKTCIRGNDAKIIIDVLKKYSGGNHVDLKNANCAIFDVNNLVCPTHGTKLYKHPNGLAYCSLCNYSIKWQTCC